ncbi:uncharacterized protein [Branchiostoma lanceolatum]|uniref:uncharacterized protein n=1 Tax=Branchiostoma lanceolatum TaxID=7740 RepID=UPI0034533E8D
MYGPGDVAKTGKDPTSTSGHDQAGQGQSQADTQSQKFGNLSHSEVLAALAPNAMYGGVGTPPQKDPIPSSGHDQTGQGQSQAIIESNTNTSASEVTSGQDQTGQGQPQAITESNTNTSATEVTSGQDQTGQGQSQAITESNTNTSATEVTSGQDQTGQGQFQAITESNTNTVVTSGHDQTWQDQSQAINESNTNATATKVTSGQDQTEQGQSQDITESLDARNLSYGTVPTASRLNSLYTNMGVVDDFHISTERKLYHW